MSGKPSSYSSSRLDLTGENVTDLTRAIATSQPWLAWLHSGDALALYKDPYIMGVLSDPVGTVARVYSLESPEDPEMGRRYLDSLFMDELGHEVTPDDFMELGAKLFTWLEARITGFRVIEMIRYLSAADSAEKLIAGSLIKEAADATQKHGDKDQTVDAGRLPTPIRDQVEQLRKDQPELYSLILEQLRQAARADGIGHPAYAPSTQPVVGETDNDAKEKQTP